MPTDYYIPGIFTPPPPKKKSPSALFLFSSRSNSPPKAYFLIPSETLSPKSASISFSLRNPTFPKSSILLSLLLVELYPRSLSLLLPLPPPSPLALATATVAVGDPTHRRRCVGEIDDSHTLNECVCDSLSFLTLTKINDSIVQNHHRSDLFASISGKSGTKGKAKSEEAGKSNPSTEELRKTICEVLKKVDFNTVLNIF